MDNNDVLRRLRYALNITDLKLIELFALAGREIGRPELEGLFKREEEAGFLPCPDELARLFLEGLVISRRGKRETPEPGPGKQAAPAAGRKRSRLTNNEILKSLRVALELKDEDILAILRLAGVEIAKPELSALFRKPEHHNYRPCGDQFLRNFLAGLTARYRG
ncbi:MAG TPA: DUF1456 family protein [Spirochaetales bacterium]|nr:DUF1456 family protein [Spirochaetales bacterium]HRY55883.1 DUF1456 family protein [Spirochaetia bacterium]HRZ66246.1 DUF1456 family protein [Spirochaetia bacterium]